MIFEILLVTYGQAYLLIKCFWFLLQHRLGHSTENKLFFSYLLFEFRDNLNLLFFKTVVIIMHTKKCLGSYMIKLIKREAWKNGALKKVWRKERVGNAVKRTKGSFWGSRCVKVQEKFKRFRFIWNQWLLVYCQ